MSKKMVMTQSPTNETTTTLAVSERWRGWDRLNPVILSLIFVKIIPVEEMVKSVCLVCKSWLEVVSGPYCWSEVDLEEWCRRGKDSHAVDLVVKKVVRRSKFCVERLSTYRMGHSGFFFVAHCGNFLKVLQMPMSDITDQMILKHIKPLPNLTFLDISHCLNITSKGVATFGNQCKSLIHLKRNMPPIVDRFNAADDSEAKAIANTMVYLQRIELGCGRFGDLGLLEILTKCKQLTSLNIHGSVNVELDGDLAVICKRLDYFKNPWVDSDDEFSDTSEGKDVDLEDSD